MANSSSNSRKKGSKVEAKLLPAADVLQSLLRNSKSELSDGFTRWQLEQQWAQIVGAELAKDTLPCAFEKGHLYIWTRHSSWMQQLWFFQGDIKQKVNAHLGRVWVKQIRFTLNHRAAQDVLPK